jgi:hypothetical protein
MRIEVKASLIAHSSQLKPNPIMKTLLFTLIILTIILIATSFVTAQPGLPGGASGPAQAPIDGGLGLLAVAGGTYAWKKLKNQNKHSETK